MKQLFFWGEEDSALTLLLGLQAKHPVACKKLVI